MFHCVRVHSKTFFKISFRCSMLIHLLNNMENKWMNRLTMANSNCYAFFVSFLMRECWSFLCVFCFSIVASHQALLNFAITVTKQKCKWKRWTYTQNFDTKLTKLPTKNAFFISMRELFFLLMRCKFVLLTAYLSLSMSCCYDRPEIKTSLTSTHLKKK